MSGFHYRVACKCGWHTQASFDSVFHTMADRCCPRCGAPSAGRSRWDWSVIAVRWVSQSFWWRPWTWGMGYWSTRDGEELEAVLAERAKRMKES